MSKHQIDEIPDGVVEIAHTESVEQIREFYGIADAFINPTLEDNYPTMNIEAIVCGTPVITFDTGGSPESAE